jgi:hypothetical protein
MPTLLAAFGYAALFGVPVEELFPGVYATVRQEIEDRLANLVRELEQSTAKGRKAPLSARKLEWFYERNNPAADSIADAKTEN